MPISKAFNQEILDLAGSLKHAIKPSDLVEFARDPDTKAHGQFEWDDEIAGEAYRRDQAARYIQFTVVQVPNTKIFTRALVPVMRGRGQGYERIEIVLSDKVKCDRMLADALEDLESFQRRYQHLTELKELFGVMEVVANKFKRKRRK